MIVATAWAPSRGGWRGRCNAEETCSRLVMRRAPRSRRRRRRGSAPVPTSSRAPQLMPRAGVRSFRVAACCTASPQGPAARRRSAASATSTLAQPSPTASAAAALMAAILIVRALIRPVRRSAAPHAASGSARSCPLRCSSPGCVERLRAIDGERRDALPRRLRLVPVLAAQVKQLAGRARSTRAAGRLPHRRSPQCRSRPRARPRRSRSPTA